MVNILDYNPKLEQRMDIANFKTVVGRVAAPRVLIFEVFYNTCK